MKSWLHAIMSLINMPKNNVLLLVAEQAQLKSLASFILASSLKSIFFPKIVDTAMKPDVACMHILYRHTWQISVHVN